MITGTFIVKVLTAPIKQLYYLVTNSSIFNFFVKYVPLGCYTYANIYYMRMGLFANPKIVVFNAKIMA